MRELVIRRNVKKRKPVIRRQDANKRKKDLTGYRKPRGYTSGQRLRKRGKVSVPLTGYSSPRKVRGLHPSGKEVIMINSLNDLKKIGKNSVGIISSKIGAKKKLEILKTKQPITNIKAPSFIKKIEDVMAKRKQKRAELMKERERKAKLKPKDKKKEKKSGEELETLEGTKKAVHSKPKEVKGAEKEVIKGLK